MLSISWERQTHIPIMTSVGREKKRLEGGREVEGRIVIAQRLSIHQRKEQLKEKKGRKATEVYTYRGTIDHRDRGNGWGRGVTVKEAQIWRLTAHLKKRRN